MADFHLLSGLKPKRVLLRAPNWLGDCVMALPGMERVSRIYPEAEIITAVRPHLMGLFRFASWCDRVVSVPGFLAAGIGLREYDCDLCVVYPNSFASALEVFIARIPVRTGFARDGRAMLLTHPVPATEEVRSVHQIMYYAYLARVLEQGERRPGLRVDEDVPFPRLAVPLGMRSSIRNKVEALCGFDPEEKRMCVCAPAAAFGPAKQWPEEHYSTLARLLNDALDMAVVLVGSDSEKELCRAISDRSDKRVVSIAGKTSLGELIEVLSLARVFVGNDSGVSHVAASLGVPAVVLFGPTEMEKTIPLGERVVPMKKDVDCAPCMKRRCPHGHQKCMVDILPEEVVSEARKILDG